MLVFKVSIILLISLASTNCSPYIINIYEGALNYSNKIHCVLLYLVSTWVGFYCYKHFFFISYSKYGNWKWHISPLSHCCHSWVLLDLYIWIVQIGKNGNVLTFCFFECALVLTSSRKLPVLGNKAKHFFP